jgi:hypothetical protein
MNDDRNPGVPRFDDDAHEREWLAQERAWRHERLGLDPAGDDARVRRYRLLARTLRQPPDEALPADFARQVAARADARHRPAAGTQPESVLVLVLAAIMLVAAMVVTVRYGSRWLPSFATVLPGPGSSASSWLLALCACIGASYLLVPLQRHSRGQSPS